MASSTPSSENFRNCMFGASKQAKSRAKKSCGTKQVRLCFHVANATNATAKEGALNEALISNASKFLCC
jgi:hypothetical protein